MKLINILSKVFILILFCSLIFADEEIKENDNEKYEDSFETFIKDLKLYEGLFDVYRNTDDGKIFLLIKKNQLDKEFIYLSLIHI